MQVSPAFDGGRNRHPLESASRNQSPRAARARDWIEALGSPRLSLAGRMLAPDQARCARFDPAAPPVGDTGVRPAVARRAVLRPWDLTLLLRTGSC